LSKMQAISIFFQSALLKLPRTAALPWFELHRAR
jgi:hypothetical protein